MVRDSVNLPRKIITPPELAKGSSATSATDGFESLGQAVGAQGALIQPE
jgi:hypothetical protein